MLQTSAGACYFTTKRKLQFEQDWARRRWRIVRQLLTESVMLSAMVERVSALAWWGTKALIAIAPASLSSLRDVTVSFRFLVSRCGDITLDWNPFWFGSCARSGSI
jgi:hypothetical protein